MIKVYQPLKFLKLKLKLKKSVSSIRIPTFDFERHRLTSCLIAVVHGKLVDLLQKGSLTWNFYCGIHIVIIFHKFGTVKCVYDKKCFPYFCNSRKKNPYFFVEQIMS